MCKGNLQFVKPKKKNMLFGGVGSKVNGLFKGLNRLPYVIEISSSSRHKQR